MEEHIIRLTKAQTAVCDRIRDWKMTSDTDYRKKCVRALQAQSREISAALNLIEELKMSENIVLADTYVKKD